MPVRVGLSKGFNREAYLKHCPFDALHDDPHIEVRYLTAGIEDGILAADEMAALAPTGRSSHLDAALQYISSVI